MEESSVDYNALGAVERRSTETETATCVTEYLATVLSDIHKLLTAVVICSD